MAYCATCKTTENLMPKPYNGHSYRCRECNTAKVKRYKMTENGKKRTYEAISKYHRNNIDKVKARYKARYYNQPPTNCSKCGVFGDVDGHHEDYSKPLEVLWLCRQCHANIHQLIMV